MNCKSILLSFSLLVMLCACGKEMKYSDELTFDINIAHLAITATDSNQQKADGEYWSRDGKSYKQTFHEGKLESIEYYTNNGKLFCRIFGQKKLFFNAEGKQISAQLAKNMYKDAYNQWIEQQKQLSKIVRGLPVEEE